MRACSGFFGRNANQHLPVPIPCASGPLLMVMCTCQAVCTPFRRASRAACWVAGHTQLNAPVRECVRIGEVRASGERSVVGPLAPCAPPS
eukprot:scaffold169854_cov49-Tisochrysis_lutea.AAC.1